MYTKRIHQMTMTQIFWVEAGCNISDLNRSGRLAILAQLCFWLGLCLNRDREMNQHMFLEATEMHTDVLQGDGVENIDQLFTNEDECICLGKRHRNCWQGEKKSVWGPIPFLVCGGKTVLQKRVHLTFRLLAAPSLSDLTKQSTSAMFSVKQTNI